MDGKMCVISPYETYQTVSVYRSSVIRNIAHHLTSQVSIVTIELIWEYEYIGVIIQRNIGYYHVSNTFQIVQFF